MFKIVTIALILMLYTNSVYSSENIKTRELLAFFKDIHSNTPLDCPERMLVNRSDGNRYYLALEILKGRLKATNKQRLVAQKKLNKLREQILIGRNWPIKKRKEVRIPYAKLKPLIDSNLNSPAWQQALQFNAEFKLSSTKKIYTGIAWRILWDEKYLYIIVKVPDSNIKSITYRKDKSKGPWDADCVEVFVMPSMRLKSYWEIVVNPDKKIFDGLNCNKKSGWFISRPEENINGLKSNCRVFKNGYMVGIVIPFKEMPNYMLGNKPKAGQSIYLNMVRTNDGEKYSPYPLLYDGHNIFGCIKGVLEKNDN